MLLLNVLMLNFRNFCSNAILWQTHNLKNISKHNYCKSQKVSSWSSVRLVRKILYGRWPNLSCTMHSSSTVKVMLRLLLLSNKPNCQVQMKSKQHGPLSRTVLRSFPLGIWKLDWMWCLSKRLQNKFDILCAMWRSSRILRLALFDFYGSRGSRSPLVFDWFHCDETKIRVNILRFLN